MSAREACDREAVCGFLQGYDFIFMNNKWLIFWSQPNLWISASPYPVSSPELKYQKEDRCVSLDTFNLELEDIFIWCQRISHKYKTSLCWNHERYRLPDYLINQNDFYFNLYWTFFQFFSQSRVKKNWSLMTEVQSIYIVLWHVQQHIMQKLAGFWDRMLSLKR